MLQEEQQEEQQEEGRRLVLCLLCRLAAVCLPLRHHGCGALPLLQMPLLSLLLLAPLLAPLLGLGGRHPVPWCPQQTSAQPLAQQQQ